MTKRIDSADLIAFDDFTQNYPILVDLVYADADHKDNIFTQAIYKPSAKCWGHKDMVHLTLCAAELCFERTGYIFEIKDCLRPIEAQATMMETEIVRANPQWTTEPDRLLSPPGKGGHPRGMAVDIILKDNKGAEIDMGTNFDFLTEDRTNNPAARNYANFSKEVLNNRQILEEAMMDAAIEMKRKLLPLPSEWWDFRFMPDETIGFIPILDKELPKDMQMMAH